MEKCWDILGRENPSLVKISGHSSSVVNDRQSLKRPSLQNNDLQTLNKCNKQSEISYGSPLFDNIHVSDSNTSILPSASTSTSNDTHALNLQSESVASPMAISGGRQSVKSSPLSSKFTPQRKSSNESLLTSVADETRAKIQFEVECLRAEHNVKMELLQVKRDYYRAKLNKLLNN